MAIRADPTGVDHHPLAGGYLFSHNRQYFLLLGEKIIKGCRVLRLYDCIAFDGVDDGCLGIRLVRIDCQQVQIRREEFLCRSGLRPQDLAQPAFNRLVGFESRRRHVQRYRDLLIIRKILSHVRQGEKRGILQKKAGIDQG